MRIILFTLFSILLITSFTSNQSLTTDIHFGQSVRLSETNLEQLDELIHQLSAQEEDYHISLEVFPAVDKDLNRKRIDAITTYFEIYNIKVEKFLFYTKEDDLPESLQSLDDYNFVRVMVEFYDENTDLSRLSSENKGLNNSENGSNEKQTNQANNNSNNNWKDGRTPSSVGAIVDYKRNIEYRAISPNQRTELMTLDSSFLIFEPNSFVYADETSSNDEEIPVRHTVRLVLKYATSKATTILDELTTTSNGEILESKGMMRVDAFDVRNKPLKLKKGASYTLKTKDPKNTFQGGFQVFAGQRTSTDESIDWLLRNGTVVEDSIVKGWIFYNHIKMNAEELVELSLKRDSLIGRWEEMGVPRRIVRKRIRRSRKSTQILDEKLANRAYTKRRIDVRQPYINRNATIGETKFKYVEFKRVRVVERFYTAKVGELGWANIDRLWKKAPEQSRCDLIVSVDSDQNIKLIFDKKFITLKGVPVPGGYAFQGVPEGLDVTILAANRSKGAISYALKSIKTSTTKVKMDGYQNTTEDKFITEIEKRFKSS